MVFDSELMLRIASAGNLTANANTGSKKIKGTPIRGLALRIHVPAAGGTTPTLSVSVQDSADDSTFTTIATHATINAVGEYVLPFATDKPFVRAAITVGGTTPNFGAVEIGIVEMGRKFSRAVNWS